MRLQQQFISSTFAALVVAGTVNAQTEEEINQAMKTPVPIKEWDTKVGSYVGQIATSHEPIVDYLTSEYRFGDFENRFDGINKALSVDAKDLCVPIYESTVMAMDEAAYEGDAFGLSNAQKDAVLMTMVIQLSHTFNHVLEELTISDTMICVDNEANLMGYFDATTNAVFFNVTGETLGEKFDIRENMSDISSVYNTVAEELFHGYQAMNKNLAFPEVFANRGVTYSSEDQVMWQLFVEAQAKTMAAVSTVEAAINGAPDVMLSYLSERDEGVHSAMSKAAMSLYLKYGEERIHQQPELLAPVFWKFFEDANALNGYHNNYIALAAINPQEQGNLLLMSDYINAFGVLPGFEGNMLANDLYDDTIYSLAEDKMAETPMRDWFLGMLTARMENKPYPTYPEIVYEVAEEALTPAPDM